MADLGEYNTSQIANMLFKVIRPKLIKEMKTEAVVNPKPFLKDRLNHLSDNLMRVLEKPQNAPLKRIVDATPHRYDNSMILRGPYHKLSMNLKNDI